MGLLLQGLFSPLSKGSHRACRARECEFGSLGLGKLCRKSPLASAQSERAVRCSPGFFYDPRATFSFGRRGLFAEPPRVRTWVTGLGKVCRESPLASAGRSIRGSPWLFYTTLALPFCSEGGVEYVRLPSMGASSGTSVELLSGKSKWRPEPRSLEVG